MSVQALFWALEQPLPATTKLVLIALANFTDDEHACWPSHARVAELVRVSRDSVRAHVKVLRDEGYIEVRERRRTDGAIASNYYVLRVQAKAAVGAKPPGGARGAGSPRGADSPRGAGSHRGAGSPGSGSGLTGLGEPAHTLNREEPPSEPPIEPERERARAEDIEARFAELTVVYPPRGLRNLPAAQAALLGAIPDLPPWRQFLATVQAWAATDEWRREGGRFAPNLDKWIYRRGWREPLPAGAPVPFVAIAPAENQLEQAQYAIPILIETDETYAGLTPAAIAAYQARVAEASSVAEVFAVRDEARAAASAARATQQPPQRRRA